jgi:hypothetical protein
MLAPDVNDTFQKLTSAYSGILAIDNFSSASQSIQIVQLPKDPDWLPPVREEISELTTASDAWQMARPQIWSGTLLAFVNYIHTFSGFASTVKASKPTTAAEWIALLQQTLLPAVGAALAATQSAERQVADKLTPFSGVLPLMDKSIQAGWDALAGEEQDMLKLTEQLGELNQTVQNLGVQLDSSIISSGKSYISTTVTMLYTAAAAGEAATVPVLGLAVAVFTTAKSFYDLVKNDDDLIAALHQINQVKAELSDDALGVALTKSTLQTLYSLEEEYLAAKDALPGLIDLWTAQQTSIQDTINALQAGANPDQYFDLLTVPIAQTSWQQINGFLQNLMNIDVTVGEPVTIDIAKAEVYPTLAASRPRRARVRS